MADPDAIAIGFAARSSDLLIASGYGRLSGWSVRETAGAVCVVRFRDGIDATGPIRGVTSLASGGESQGPNMDEGIRFTTGLYMERVSGTFEGAVYIRAS
jgi:hypothetical protein